MHTPEGFTPSHALPAALPADTLAFAFRDGRILVGGTADAPVVPVVAQLERLGLRGDRHYLGELGRTGCVAVHLPDDAREPEGWRYAGLRALFFRLPEPILAIAARAFQVVEWDRTHRYCGRCGTPTRDKPGERAKECPACDYTAYPRVTPAMMVLVTRGRELLLARAPRFPPACSARWPASSSPARPSRTASTARSAKKWASRSAPSGTSRVSRGRFRIR